MTASPTPKRSRGQTGAAIALSAGDPPWLAHRKIVLRQTTAGPRGETRHNPKLNDCAEPTGDGR